MLRWGQAAMEVIGPMNQRTAENFPIAGELYEWCTGVRAEDLAPGSVGRGIFEAEARGAIPPKTAGNIIHQYLGAGVDTTIAAIGNIVALFSAHPDQFDLVRKNPALVPAAFNEVLRFWAPVHAWGRLVTKDVEIDGTLVPAGSQAAILFGAGNRDPRHYENRTPSWSNGTRSTTSPSVTARTAAPARASPVWKHTPSSRHRRTTFSGWWPPSRSGAQQHHPLHRRTRDPGGSTSMKKIVLDRPRCEGHGLCEEIAPDLMHLDDEGELILDVEELPEGSPELADAGAAIRVCPVAALKLA